MFEGIEVRTAVVDGNPWWVLADVTRALGLGNTSAVASRLDDDEKGVTQIDTPGGMQTVGIVNEPGLYSVVLRSDKPEAKRFKRWITHEVIPSIRKTGSYSPALDLTSPEGVLALAEKFTETARALVAATGRAEIAEEFKAAIEVADGLTPREFHKHYLSDLGERAFFQLLYTRGLLIDQRGMRVDANGKPKAGKQHGHPGFRGKAFFYLHPTVNRDGNRFENTRVRPGAPELALVEFFTARGYSANTNSDNALEAIA